MVLRWCSCSIFLAICVTSSVAETPPSPPAPTLSERAARRFPQPVRVGDLIDRYVLQPVPAQHVLGRVDAITRNGRGELAVIVRFGGWFGLGWRLIAVPVEAVALLGEHVVVMDFTPQQLRDFPTATPSRTEIVASDDTIRVGLTKPFH